MREKNYAKTPTCSTQKTKTTDCTPQSILDGEPAPAPAFLIYFRRKAKNSNFRGKAKTSIQTAGAQQSNQNQIGCFYYG